MDKDSPEYKEIMELLSELHERNKLLQEDLDDEQSKRERREADQDLRFELSKEDQATD